MSERNVRFQKWQAYIVSQMRDTGKPRSRPESHNTSITLSRETGAGAVTLGDLLAQRLNELADGSEIRWTVFDKNLIKQVLEDHDLPARLERFMPEDKPRPFANSVGDMLGLHPPDWKLQQHAQETIYRLAKMGGCILVGRGANIITESLPNVLHVRLVGELAKRVTRCMDYYGFDETRAREFVTNEDRARRRYVLAYYDREVGDPQNYHMVVNVDRFTTTELVDLICGAVSPRQS